MFRTALLILSGNAAASLLLLARNLLLARLVSVEDYAIAATFAISMSIVEMMSHLGLQQQIVQAKDGNDPRFQSALQGFQLLRGVIASILLFFAAELIADFMNIPHVAWAYQVLALVPILNALQHFDIYRLNREMRFWPMVLTGGVPALLSLLVLWPFFLMFGDYRVMLCAIIVQFVFMMVISHMVAERPYRLILDSKIMAGSLRFGWPLLVNSMLMFLVFNGDKLIVGRELGMPTLAILAMGFTLTLTPTLVMSRSAQNFFLPLLSKLDRTVEEQVSRFQHLSMVSLQIGLLNGAILVIAIAFFGRLVVEILLGEKYMDLIALLMPLAVLHAVRVAKSGSATVSLAAGYTVNTMYPNLVRVVSLPIAWYVVLQGGGLLSVVWIAILAEALGYLLSLWLLHVRVGTQLRPMVMPILSFVAFLAVATVIDYAATVALSFGWLEQLALVIVLAIVLLTMIDLRRYVVHRYDRA